MLCIGCRRKAAEHFRWRTYHRRYIIESGNHSNKAKFSSGVNSKKATTIRSDVCVTMDSLNMI